MFKKNLILLRWDYGFRFDNMTSRVQGARYWK